jgi:hypothetical protein
MATTYLSRTNTTGTSTQKGTISVWIKSSEEPNGNNQTTLASWGDANNHGALLWNGSDKIDAFDYQSGYASQLQTNAVLRDCSAWYHIVYSWDTTLATADDRQKIYINGVEQTYSTRTNYSLNAATSWNANSYSKRVGTLNSSSYFSGSMTHVHFIDGLQYAASNFGETNSTSGIWTAKTTPSVTYGNNGFFLKMENASAMGTDSSGESNTFTVSGSLTKNQDTPDNNFATMNPLDNYYQNQTFTQGNNTVKSDNPSPVKSTLGVSSGKWYIEAKALSVVGSGSDYQIGIISSQVVGTQELGHYSNDYSYYGADGSYRNNDSFTSYGNSYTAGDIIGVAIDLDNNKLYFSKNGTFQNSGDPTSGSTGTGAISITTPSSTELGAYFLGVGGNANSNKYNWNANFGNGHFGTTAVSSAGTNASSNGIFEYDVPTGYTALSTKGLNS